MDTDRKPLLPLKRIVALAGIILMLSGTLAGLNACTPRLPGTGANTPMPYSIDSGAAAAVGENAAQSGGTYNISVGLSEGQAQTETPVPRPVVTGEPLTSQEIDEIFARLPNLPVIPQDQAEFKYPVQLLPPPRPGTVIKESFPAVELALPPTR
jgi:hypothetical protein